jgi:4-hydroxy-3-polyprenylbenzoate decarboxylase
MAHGLGDNLISRAAQVTLKERRRLIIVHREMPLGIIEIKNMLELAQAGAILCPANPGFYHLPQTIDDIVNFVVARVMDLLDIPHTLSPRWTGEAADVEKQSQV